MWRYMYVILNKYSIPTCWYRKGNTCPPVRSAKLKIIYGLKWAKTADLDTLFSLNLLYIYMCNVYIWWLLSRGGGASVRVGSSPKGEAGSVYHIQCSPQVNFKAWWEGKIWVEPLATSKLLHSSHFHIKGRSKLKACWADMPCVCWGEHWYCSGCYKPLHTSEEINSRLDMTRCWLPE